MTSDGAMSFLASKAYEKHVNPSIKVKDIGGISVHVAENWKHLKDSFAFSSFRRCKNRNRVLIIMMCCPIYHWLSVSREVFISPAHLLCPRYSGTLSPTVISLWVTLTFKFYKICMGVLCM